jgi:pimeloyl-ACP methyl ester carboxylesterase
MPALEARGVELNWSAEGEGTAVLLVHETATSAAIWGPVAKAIARGSGEAGAARALSYDRRGWGRSSAPDGYQRTTVEEQSEDAAELLAAAGAGPAVLCGAGLGAVIALDLLLRRPELVRAALLIEPTLLALLPDATEALSEDRVELETAVRDHGAPGAVGLYLSGRLAALGAGAERLPTALTADARTRPESLFAELGAAATWSMPLLRFASAERPSLIVTAGSTPPLLRESARALDGRLGMSQAAEIEVARTPPHVGAPDRVAELAGRLAARAPGGP